MHQEDRHGTSAQNMNIKEQRREKKLSRYEDENADEFFWVRERHQNLKEELYLYGRLFPHNFLKRTPWNGVLRKKDVATRNMSLLI